MVPPIFRAFAARLCLGVVAFLFVGPSARLEAFTTFESGQVRPLALAEDGQRLFALNTPDNRLEIFDLSNGEPRLVDSVLVGLEPVAVAVRSDSEVWVVNHLSDSVSIVDVGADVPHVRRTLLVGDEPRDIVFAGPQRDRAFVTCAHRGQNRPGDPELTTPGVGRADVWVFDGDDLGAPAGGTALAIVSLFGDTPRALAVSPDGATVYAAVFHSGNETTVVHEQAVCDGGEHAGPCDIDEGTVPGGLPAPNTTQSGARQPETGLIVRHDRTTGSWEDPLGRDWREAVRFSLPDRDVFAIDAMATPPVEIASFAHVGTVLFNMAVNPASGKVYVSNTEARNEVRFEGAGLTGATSVRGHLHESRITVLDGTSVLPRHLNKHIDYGVVPSPETVRERSLATPVDMVVSADGTTLYVAAFGSSAVGYFETEELEDDSFVPSATRQIPLTGGGPSGLVLDEARQRLYVLTRFDNAIAVVDTSQHLEIGRVPLHNPEPAAVVNGRRFLYDARLTSSNGEASCASCHVFGDLDSLAWDLGDPDDVLRENPNPSADGLLNFPFHPLKGPMTTQTLRGMARHGPMHWRGDRTGGSNPGGNPLDARQAFLEFNGAFTALLGNDGVLPNDEMGAFADFVLQIAMPPNPIRALDNSLSPDEAAGRAVFLNAPSDGGFTCVRCHALDPVRGFFGTDGRFARAGGSQGFKVPHLRNLYQKVGMFGLPGLPFFPQVAGDPVTEQIRGFGFQHDGATDTLFRFLHALPFVFAGGDVERRQVEKFLLAFDTDLPPIVGQQITLSGVTAATANPRIDLLEARADAGECDVVVKGIVGGEARAWASLSPGVYRSDRTQEATTLAVLLRQLGQAPGSLLTYTCVPRGSGTRIGIDRDGDAFLDCDENDAGTDPADPASFPMNGTPIPTASYSPTASPTAEATPTPSASATASATTTPTPTPSASSTSTASVTPTITPTLSATPTSTPTVTATETATPTSESTETSSPSSTPTETPTSLPTTPTFTPTEASGCRGDCDASGVVTIDELVRSVNGIAGGGSATACGVAGCEPTECLPSLREILGNALGGCTAEEG